MTDAKTLRDGWRDIATAGKGGEWRIVRLHNGAVYRARYDKEEDVWWEFDAGFAVAPSWWMPEPPSPTAPKTEG